MGDSLNFLLPSVAQSVAQQVTRGQSRSEDTIHPQSVKIVSVGSGQYPLVRINRASKGTRRNTPINPHKRIQRPQETFYFLSCSSYGESFRNTKSRQ